jgi:hypothetical protein
LDTRRSLLVDDRAVIRVDDEIIVANDDIALEVAGNANTGRGRLRRDTHQAAVREFPDLSVSAPPCAPPTTVFGSPITILPETLFSRFFKCISKGSWVSAFSVFAVKSLAAASAPGFRFKWRKIACHSPPALSGKRLMVLSAIDARGLARVVNRTWQVYRKLRLNASWCGLIVNGAER